MDRRPHLSAAVGHRSRRRPRRTDPDRDRRARRSDDSGAVDSGRDVRTRIRARARPALADGVREASRFGTSGRDSREGSRPGGSVSADGRFPARGGGDGEAPLPGRPAPARGVCRGCERLPRRGFRAADRIPAAPRPDGALDTHGQPRLGQDDGLGPRRQRPGRDPARALRRNGGPREGRAAASAARLGTHDPELAATAAPPAAPWKPLDEAFVSLAALGLSRGESFGSNSWVLSGARTSSGKPILANDPHLGLRVPSVWYLVSFDAPGLRTTGATLP